MLDKAKPLDWKGLLLVGVSIISVLNGLVELRGDMRQAIALLVLGVTSFRLSH